MSYKHSVNPVISQNPMSGHRWSLTRDNIVNSGKAVVFSGLKGSKVKQGFILLRRVAGW
jgi:hypothetical protein